MTTALTNHLQINIQKIVHNGHSSLEVSIAMCCDMSLKLGGGRTLKPFHLICCWPLLVFTFISMYKDN